jgi:hypothetical protein
MQFRRDGGSLEPGQLLGTFPPFCTNESAVGVSLAAVSAVERLRFLAALAAQLRDLPEGGKVDFRVEE